MTIRTRLTLTAALSSLLAVLLVAAGLYLAIGQFLEGDQQGRLRAAAAQIQLRLGEHAGSEASGDENQNWQMTNDFPRDIDVRLIAAGRVLDRTRDFPNLPLNLGPGFHRSPGHLVLVQPASDEGQATLQLAADLTFVNAPLRAFLRALVLMLPLAVLMVAAAGWFTAERLLRPVRDLERTASEIGSSGDLTRAMPGAKRNDELGRLAQALAKSFASLARQREREVEFSRAAAHDLRSPLTALQARVQASLARERDPARYRQDLREIGSDLQRLNRLTEHLLLLARDQNALRLEPLELSTVIAEGVDRARETNPDTSIELELSGDTHMRGDALLLTHLIENLLGNALRHAPGSSILVGLKQGKRTLELRVSDTGPGVSPGVLERLGQAFYRPETARTDGGSGLGLAIVKRIAELHGGTLRLESQRGQGFAAIVELPTEAD
jgi:signal transduction histidine kinase